MARRAALLVATLLSATACGAPDEPRNMSAAEVAAELRHLRIEPGLWVLTGEVVDVDAPHLPILARSRMLGPRRASRNCIDPAQAARPGARFLAARGDRSCVYRDFTVRDGRLEGTMHCPDGTTMMRGRYGPRGYDLRMEIRRPLPGGAAMRIDVRAHGRRVGPCAAGETG